MYQAALLQAISKTEQDINQACDIWDTYIKQLQEKLQVKSAA